MKILYFTILLSCTPALLFAQSDVLVKKLEWSETYRISENYLLERIIPYEKGFYTIRADRDHGSPVFIGVYDEAMKLEREVGFSPTARGKDWAYEGLIWMNQNFYLLSSFYDRANGKNTLYKQTIDKANPKLKLGELVSIANHSFASKFEEHQFEILTTEEKNGLLVYDTTPQSSEYEIANISFFQADFEEQWTKQIILPFPKNDLELVERKISSNGDLYILSKLYNKGRLNRRKGFPNYSYVLLQYSSEAKEAQIYHLECGEDLITDLKFQIQEDHIVSSGLISHNKSTQTDGVCYFNINLKKKEIELQKVFSFADDRSLLNKQNINSSNEIELPNYLKIDHLFLRSDGGVLLIAERSFQVSKYTYQDDDILLINIKASGGIEWLVQVPKKQSSYYTEDQILSYFPAIVQDKIYLIYNDDGRNFSFDKPRKRLQRHKSVKGFSSLTAVNKDGSWRAYPLSDNSLVDLAIYPKACQQIGTKTILLYEAFNNNYRFGKLILK